MDCLPKEIINRMVWLLDRYPNQQSVPNIEQSGIGPSALPPYAAISKQWKEAVEFVTFHRLSIWSGDLSQLQAIVTNNRCKYLRKLGYTIVLPKYSKERGKSVETKEEQQCSNGTFTQRIIDLFSVLSQREEAGLLTELRLKIEDPKCSSDGYMFKRRWGSTYLKLSRYDRIPTISNISYLQIQSNFKRRTSPAIVPGLAAFLPGLKHIFAEFYEGQWYEVSREAVPAVNRTRLAFAELLEQRTLTHISVAKFDCHQERQLDQRIPSPSILPPGTFYDPFSVSLRVFSQNLTTFVLSGYIDSTLFWPSSHETSSPSWPSVKRLKICFNAAAPSGDWYFIVTPQKRIKNNSSSMVIQQL
jgi:hypothetical protein